MDLEMVGRHALLFDDDAMAAFVNSGDALVDWNSLQIDRYDVRHLLSGPLPPRRRRNPQPLSHLSDSSLNSELDHERYLDLPPASDEPEVEEAEKPGGTGSYHAMPFSYGNTDNSADQNHADEGLECPRFRPPFSVPESLLHSLPPTEKVHEIIARTAMFVSKHGGQSEIVLRVKQGDNPTFGFLMPDHNHHAYFRFLIDNQEVLLSDSDRKTHSVDADAEQNKLGVGGALSLLGSVYGSGEDEDSVIDDAQEFENVPSRKVMNASGSIVSHVSENTESSTNAASKDEVVVKYPLHSKEKTSALKKNPSIAASKAGKTSSIKKEDVSGSYSTSLEKLKEPSILEPPSDLKILVDKIVDFILKNGKQFEAALREQDSKQGRFPFLIPSNQYHPYFLKVLQKSQESKVGAKNSFGKDDSARLGPSKKSPAYKEDDATSSTYIGFDVPYESDRKEKFKMIIGKSKKDLPDPPSKATQQERGISIDAEAAAAILQAVMRGLKDPYPGSISSSSLNGQSQCHGSNVRQGSEIGQNSVVPDGKAIAKAAVSKTASQAECEPHLTKEQKVKAERLKRAKMFVATLKSGAVPSKDEPLRALSLEPSELGVSGSAAEVNHDIEGEGSISAPADFSMSEKNENSETKYFRDELSEKRSKRKYRSRSERHEENDENNAEEERGQDNSEYERRQDGEEKKNKHYRKKHHSHRSSRDHDYDNDYNKATSHSRSKKRHRSRRPSHEDDGEKNTDSSSHRHSSKKHSSQRRKHEEDDGKDHKRSRKKHRSHRSSHQSKDGCKERKVYSSGREDSQPRKYDSSSGDEHGHSDMYIEVKNGSVSEREELEEGEISPKFSNQTKSAGGHVSRETSVDTSSAIGRASSQHSEATYVSDDLRAKIRAMLMTTR